MEFWWDKTLSEQNDSSGTLTYVSIVFHIHPTQLQM